MKLVQGVGLNDLPKGSCSHMVYGKQIAHPFYEKWKSMLRRCYNKDYHSRYPTYIGCSVCEEWKTLSNFKQWFCQQPIERQAWQLDKDILFVDNKTYSPKTCILVPNWLNSFVIDGGTSRSTSMLGTAWNSKTQKFQAQIRDREGKGKYLGVFTDELSAHLAWKSAKLQMVQDMKKKNLTRSTQDCMIPSLKDTPDGETQHDGFLEKLEK